MGWGDMGWDAELWDVSRNGMQLYMGWDDIRRDSVLREGMGWGGWDDADTGWDGRDMIVCEMKWNGIE